MHRYVVSKWRKTATLLENEALKAHIPKTVRMTRNSLLSMLQEYQMVYIKPDVGTFGMGVMRVEWNPQLLNGYRYQLRETIRSFVSYDSMYQDIERNTKKRRYLAQKGIQLLKYQKRRFDIRVTVQKNQFGEWETSGWIGRVAHPKKIVTNYHNGGTLEAVEDVMSDYLPSKQRQQNYIEKLKHFGTQIAKQLGKNYPGIKEIGIDLAIDNQLKPWILEVNTKPDPFVYRILKDKSIYHRVIRNFRAYQRK